VHASSIATISVSLGLPFVIGCLLSVDRRAEVFVQNRPRVSVDGFSCAATELDKLLFTGAHAAHFFNERVVPVV
jgi:hypothetical protein